MWRTIIQQICLNFADMKIFVDEAINRSFPKSFRIACHVQFVPYFVSNNYTDCATGICYKCKRNCSWCAAHIARKRCQIQKALLKRQQSYRAGRKHRCFSKEKKKINANNTLENTWPVYAFCWCRFPHSCIIRNVNQTSVSLFYFGHFTVCVIATMFCTHLLQNL